MIYILFRLATDGFPISCEGDVDGVLGCTIAKFLGCGAVYLSDWLEHDQMTLTLWHGGMAPLQLSEPFDSSYHKNNNRHMNDRLEQIRMIEGIFKDKAQTSITIIVNISLC